MASALVEQCSQWGVVTTVGYLRGAHSRLAAFTENTADIVLLSSGSAQMLMKDTAAEGYELFEVGNGSYYRPESLVVVEKPIP